MMPSRLLDGDSLWTSKKLNDVPTEYRAEYANLIPLAAANGVFDPDPDLVWRTVYAFNRPNVTKDRVALIIDAFVTAGMIEFGTESGKTWATFIGIEKEGRLPPPSRRGSVAKLPPSPVEWERPTEVEPDEPRVQQKGLPYLKLIPDICRKTIGVRPENEDWYKKDLKELAATYGGTELVEAFEVWAKTVKTQPRSPVREFIRIADGLLSNKVQPENSQLEALCVSLYKTGNQVFTGKYKQLLNSLMAEFSFQELERAYKSFISTKDDYDMKFAVRDFVEGAAKTIILSTRKKTESDELQQEVIAVAAAKGREAVEQELAQLENEIEEIL